MDVTWGGIFQFCMLIAAVIALVLQANNKKRQPLPSKVTIISS